MIVLGHQEGQIHTPPGRNGAEWCGVGYCLPQKVRVQIFFIGTNVIAAYDNL